MELEGALVVEVAPAPGLKLNLNLRPVADAAPGRGDAPGRACALRPVADAALGRGDAPGRAGALKLSLRLVAGRGDAPGDVPRRVAIK